jgi:CheY-like chemotaxis protein
MISKKILVIDDDKAILNALEMLLELSGYDVVATTEAKRTFKMVDETHPDAILLDMYLSGSDGREICKKLKIKKETKDIPVIMISANPNAGKDSKKVGADFFLEKPFDIGVLLSLLSYKIANKQIN